jgi:hypothetical protein
MPPKPARPLNFTINDKPFTSLDSDHQAAALLRLAGLDPRVYDLFLVTAHGVEEAILDSQIINLVDNAAFVARRKVRFTIDGEPFATYDEDQTAADLLRLAGVDPASYDLARIRRGGGSSTIPDEEMITITDGDEFVTAKHVGGVA